MLKNGKILSGMRPTGKLHLGNLFGALENWVRLQYSYECYFMVADWHALTTGYSDTSNIKNDVHEMVVDWIAAGLDPEKCVIFRQSDVKEHAELHLLLSMITPLGWLERCPTYKEQIHQLEGKDISSYGFLGYPLLQAADILIYKADTVPVGEDQIPHVELTREIARRFNYIYGPIFPEPQAKMNKVTMLTANDGRKMSKSYGNVINISSTPDEFKTYVSNMITDPARIKKTDPGHPDICSVFAYHKVFNPDSIDEIRCDCENANIGCVACKRNLADKILEFMAPIHERRAAICDDVDYIAQVLQDGKARATSTAAQTMIEVREAMKL